VWLDSRHGPNRRHHQLVARSSNNLFKANSNDIRPHRRACYVGWMQTCIQPSKVNDESSKKQIAWDHGWCNLVLEELTVKQSAFADERENKVMSLIVRFSEHWGFIQTSEGYSIWSVQSTQFNSTQFYCSSLNSLNFEPELSWVELLESLNVGSLLRN